MHEKHHPRRQLPILEQHCFSPVTKTLRPKLGAQANHELILKTNPQHPNTLFVNVTALVADNPQSLAKPGTGQSNRAPLENDPPRKISVKVEADQCSQI